jgi:hypothetical protein
VDGCKAEGRNDEKVERKILEKNVDDLLLDQFGHDIEG